MQYSTNNTPATASTTCAMPSSAWACASREALAPRPSRLAPRRGISLLEILISMFVLLFGLMGVAAIFPVGNHYAGKGDQLDRGAAMADAALAELKSRGLLRPSAWYYANQSFANNKPLGNPLIDVDGFFLFGKAPATSGPGYAFVIDPIGASDNETSVAADGAYFPYGDQVGLPVNPNPWSAYAPTPPPMPLIGDKWPIRRVTLATPNPALPSSLMALPPRVAEAMMRLHDDVAVSQPDEDDRPGIQRWLTVDNSPVDGSPNNTPDDFFDDAPLARAYVGSYSWLATVVPTSSNNDPTRSDALQAMQPGDADYGAYKYDVSVAVFRKRSGAPSAESERTLQALLSTGGDLTLYSDTGDAGDDFNNVETALEDIRASEWIALAGVHPTTGAFHFKWYRLLAIDDETNDAGTYPAERRAMLENVDLSDPLLNNGNLRAILMPGVIGVATQTLDLETSPGGPGSPWAF